MAGCIHLHQKEKSFSAFAIVQNEEFQQSGSRREGGEVKRCEEIMGPFTLFTLTWGLPKPVMGMTLSSFPRCHFHTFPPPRPVCLASLIAALILKSVEGLMTERCRETMEEKKPGGKKGGWHAGRDKCELEVSKNAPLWGLKSLLSHKTTSPHQLRHVAPGQLFLVGFVEKRGIKKKGSKPTKPNRRGRKKLPASLQDLPPKPPKTHKFNLSCCSDGRSCQLSLFKLFLFIWTKITCRFKFRDFKFQLTIIFFFCLNNKIQTET